MFVYSLNFITDHDNDIQNTICKLFLEQIKICNMKLLIPLTPNLVDSL